MTDQQFRCVRAFLICMSVSILGIYSLGRYILYAPTKQIGSCLRCEAIERLLGTGQRTAAYSLAQYAVRDDAKFGMGHFYLGLYYIDRRQYDRARMSLTTANSLATNNKNRQRALDVLKTIPLRQ